MNDINNHASKNDPTINSISDQLEKENNPNKNESILINEIKRQKERSRKRVSFADMNPIANKNVIYSIVEQRPLSVYNKNDWENMDENERVSYVVFSIFKVFLIIILLYAFLIFLDLMSTGFTLVSNYDIEANKLARFLFSNFFLTFTLAIMFTALIQNSTVVATMVIAMVGTGIIKDVKNGIPIIMGANIGSCFKNLFLAPSLGNPNKFKRAINAATINDGFYLFTTAILLPLEIFFDFLLNLSGIFVNYFMSLGANDKSNLIQTNFLKNLVNPITENFIVLNKTVSLRCCSTQTLHILRNSTMGKLFNNESYTNKIVCTQKCTYWCMPILELFDDVGTGLFWIVISVIFLISCLFGILKLFSSFLSGPIAKSAITSLNVSYSGNLKWITHLLLFIFSLFLTTIVQNSNTVISTIINLCTLNVISLQKVYAITLGANIGTTFSGFLTALMQTSSSANKSLQIALVNSLINIFGVVFWMPVPYLRFPKFYAKIISKMMFDYKCFFYFYTLFVYFIGPIFIFVLALLKPYWIGLIIIGVGFLAILISFVLFKILKRCFSCNFNAFFKKIYHPLKQKENKSLEEFLSDECISYYEDHKPNAFMTLYRKVNVMNGLVKEGKRFSETNFSTNLSSDESEDEEFELFYNRCIVSPKVLSIRNVIDITSTPKKSND